MTLKKIFLTCAVISLSLSALAGIAAFLGLSFWSDTFARVITTTLSVAYFSITSLTCAVVMGKYRLLRFTWTGIGISLIALLYILLTIWYEDFMYYIMPSSSYLEKFMGMSFLLPYYFAHVALLFKPLRLACWSKRSRWISFASVTAFTLILTGSIFELYDHIFILPYFDYDELSIRFTGVFAIITVCSSVLMLIFIKFESIRKIEQVTTTTLKIQLVCPRCKQSQVLPVGNQRCNKCKLKIKFEIEEPLCPKCGYILYKLVGTHCPECGIEINEIDRWMGQPAAASSLESDDNNNNNAAVG